jgi:chromate reductase
MDRFRLDMVAAPLDVAVLVGSLRRGSLSGRVAAALAALAPAGLALEPVPIGELPLYDEDLEASPPPAWQALRRRIARADGLLFVTPEYNRSMPAALKNALDVGSRPWGQSVWAGKPAAIVSLSTGGLGGFGANHHLRQTLVFLDVPTLAQPEAYVAGAGGLFDEAGMCTDGRTREHLTGFMRATARWLALHAPPRATAAAG